MSDVSPGSGLVETCYRGIGPFLRLCGEADGAFLRELDGSLSALVPTIPLASIFNATVFDRSRPKSLARALDLVWDEYDRIGVMRWSAWIVDGDTDAEAIAAGRGMTIDSRPRAMGARLDELDLSASTESVVERWDLAAAATINERAYSVPDGLFGAAAASRQLPGTRCFLALTEDGKPAASVVTVANGEDCGVYWVGCDPEFQGQGRSLAAMTAALVAARQQGFATTTLQATPSGEGLYKRLGFRDLGAAINLWQHTQYAA